MNEGDRKTRYNCTSFPPPGLEKIYKQIRRSLTKGHLKTQADIRAAAGAADREYSDRGPQDELQRFLRNMGVFVEDQIQGGFYFDEKRAEVVAAACVARSLPGPPPDPISRLAQLMSEASRKIAALSALDMTPGSNGSAKNVSSTTNGGSLSEAVETVATSVPAESKTERESIPPSEPEDWGSFMGSILSSDLRPYSEEELGAAKDNELEEYVSKLKQMRRVIESTARRAEAELKRRIEMAISYAQSEREEYAREIARIEAKERDLHEKIAALQES